MTTGPDALQSRLLQLRVGLSSRPKPASGLKDDRTKRESRGWSGRPPAASFNPESHKPICLELIETQATYASRHVSSPLPFSTTFAENWDVKPTDIWNAIPAAPSFRSQPNKAPGSPPSPTLVHSFRSPCNPRASHKYPVARHQTQRVWDLIAGYSSIASTSRDLGRLACGHACNSTKAGRPHPSELHDWVLIVYF